MGFAFCPPPRILSPTFHTFGFSVLEMKFWIFKCYPEAALAFQLRIASIHYFRDHCSFTYMVLFAAFISWISDEHNEPLRLLYSDLKGS